MAAANGQQPRWSAHPWRARGLRLLVYALPIAGSLAFVRLATSVVAVPTASLWMFLLWWLGMSLAATGVVSLVYAVSRRLLPLGALLDLSLVFPDESPSRFKLALRTGTVESLEERLRQLRQGDEPASAQEAAEILLQLAAALDVHDKITRGHSERVRAYSYSLGKQLSLGTEELDRLNWAALLHDVGKLDVSTEILNKPGKPTDEEWEQLRRHPLYGETMVEPLNEWLGTWTDAVGYHHENWDGKGYPRGIAGEEIPLAGRIVAIADVYDVITSARSYKEPASATEARAELARCAGTQFDPRLVRAFVNISLGKMRLVMGPLSWLSHAPLLARMPLTPFLGASLGGVAVIATTAAAGIAGPTHIAEAATLGAAQPAAPIVGTQLPSAPARPPTRFAVPVKSDPPKRPVQPAVTAATLPTRVADTAEVSELPPAVQPEAEPSVPFSTPPAPPEARPAPAPKPPTPSGTTPPLPVPPIPSPPVPPATPLPNTAPSFTAGANQSALEDAGAHWIVGWATAISPGPATELTQTVAFTVSADNTSLFIVQPAIEPSGKLTFTSAANAKGSATITVTAVDDGGTANGGNNTSAPATFTITIASVNDAPSFSAGANQAVLEDAGAQSVTGWATAISPGPANETSQAISFAASADNPALFTAQPAVNASGKLTYTTAANANGAATITVTAVDNGGTSSGGSNTSAPATFTITISPVNDSPSFTAGANQTVLEDTGAQSVTAWATAISPGPANESSQSVTFTASADNPTLFDVQPAIAPDGTLTYTLAPDEFGVATVTVTAVDDGGTANGGSDTSTRTFTIDVLLVNHTPTFAAGVNQAALEDAGAQSVVAWASAISRGPASEASQIISFSVSADNPALFSVQPAIAADGTLTYTTATNANGLATVTVTAVDDGGTANGGTNTSAPSAFTITITAVNDAPSFSAGSDQSVVLPLGVQTVPGWAAGITGGPADESSQNVTFVVTNDNPGLFTVQPAIAPNGTLTYTAPLLATGVATVTVRIVDNGGTANGGSDTSAPQTFTITLLL